MYHNLLTLTDSQRNALKEFCKLRFERDDALGALGKDHKLAWIDYYFVVLLGLEVGWGPMLALDFIDIVHGKLGVSPAGMLNLINREGLIENMQVHEETETTSTITITRKGWEPYTHTLTRAEIDLMGISKASGGKVQRNWQTMPAIMLQWRNISHMGRVLFSDVLGRRYLGDEIGGSTPLTPDGQKAIYLTPPPGSDAAMLQALGQAGAMGMDRAADDVLNQQVAEDYDGVPYDDPDEAPVGPTAIARDDGSLMDANTGEVIQPEEPPTDAPDDEGTAPQWNTFGKLLQSVLGFNVDEADGILSELMDGGGFDHDNHDTEMLRLAKANQWPMRVDLMRYVKDGNKPPYLLCKNRAIPRAEIYIYQSDAGSARDRIRNTGEPALVEFVNGLDAEADKLSPMPDNPQLWVDIGLEKGKAAATGFLIV